MTEPESLPVSTLRLSGDCGLRTIRALRDEIAAALRTSHDVTIECSSAERIDLSFVQLVTAAAATASRQARRIRLVNLSEAGQNAFVRAGLTAPAA